MAKESKGQKFGRHGRNPSSKLQAARTKRNKDASIKAAGPKATLAGGRPHPLKPISRAMKGLNERFYLHQLAKAFAAQR